MIKICKNCKKEFSSNRSSRKFCSKSCSTTFNNKKKIVSRETKNKISEAIKEWWDNVDEKQSNELFQKMSKTRKKNTKEKLLNTNWNDLGPI